MEFPDTLRYTENHEWIRLEDDGRTATIGITDFAQHELGDIVYVELEPVGTVFEAGEVFGTVEAVKTVSELFMPVAGMLAAHNEDLEDAPHFVNEDPYGKGWMIRIEVADNANLGGLLDADAYAEKVSNVDG